ncbi:MAG TPA: CDP-alcohol phosphatidyltransferase family protein [Gemmatimonadaceae bacterium]|jgi:CDP-diacylglycerol--glycerol-3-phosphate 3-phosphatidyltransferase|nr:CDP-alcohol phosphatidyltransferase family protein [Gemmatimonadaceae bacterium]
MNLPNAITIGRICAAPALCVLPFMSSTVMRGSAFVLFVIAAVTDYYDGKLARSRNSVTNLGRLLDPLADKLLLFATLVPMSILMAPQANWVAPLLDRTGQVSRFAFMTPFGDVPLPWWIVLIVVSREVFMTVFRHTAARRGHVIAAIGPAKWKTGLQSLWVGSAFFWFAAATFAAERGWWKSDVWQSFAMFNGIVGTLAMVGAVALTLYSLLLYLQQYRRVLVH